MTARPPSFLRLLFACSAVAGLAPAAVGAAPYAPAPRWQATLDRVVPAVVVLRASVPRTFDTEEPADELATGFVVDAERGLILTNRHVVNPGPATIEAVFLDHEEVPVRVVYRDPVHDFGIVRFDPANVEFMTPGELQLVPEHARVGTEIRVVGNDAGEKLSILAGTLARLDREAPDYGDLHYNDFNTFYYQAASATSGGSSGSPVVDVHGHAVALNAGGRRIASSSFYLPLEPVVRALDLIRKGEPVARGTLETVFAFRPYDEVRRLGLRSETEAEVRRSDPGGIGMLVVDEVVPAGPADGKLEVGDVLVRAGGRLITRFGPLGVLLDDAVGEEVSLEVERGGQPVSVTLTVRDLHAITPADYLEMGGAILHELSYQQARNHGVPVGGVYLASAGYMFARAGVKRRVILSAVGGEKVETLDQFEARMASFANGELIPVRFFALDALGTEAVAVVTIDRRWFKMQRCRRDDTTGEWPCEASPPPPPRRRPKAATTSFSGDWGRPVRDLAPSIATVDVDIPFRVDGVHGHRFQGAGIVADAERGLVVVDRETVPVALGDVMITFAESLQVPGEIVYVHPAHNLALVRYDPALLGDTPVRSVTFRAKDLETDDEVWLVGLSSRQQLVSRKTRVARVEEPRISLTNPPRFRETNIELIGLSDSASTIGGVISDEKGRVYALWAAFSVNDDRGPASLFGGIPARAVVDMLEIARSNGARQWRSLGVELHPINLAEARTRGLGNETARRIESRKKSRRRVLSVVRITAGTAAAELLREGDLLLSIDGRPADSFAEVERAAQAERVALTVLRDGEELTLDVATTPQSGRGTDRFLFWEGALLQTPHPAVSAQHGVAPGGVYVSWFWFGSPANRSRLLATHRIVEVDGIPITKLDAFLAVTMNRPNGRAVRLKTIDLDGKASVVTLKPDPHFWPTREIRRGPEGWERIDDPKPQFQIPELKEFLERPPTSSGR
jgi:S1-C subfamily serine protease